MPSGPQTVTSHFLKKYNKREPDFFSRNKLELIFIYVTANLIYQPNFLHEKKKTCSRILIYGRKRKYLYTTTNMRQKETNLTETFVTFAVS